jgi:shikimate 5-dehydrogenase
VERANRLAARFIDRLTKITFDIGGLEQLADPAVMADVALAINATPMGLNTGRFAPLAYHASPADCVFYDMVYALKTTPFLTPALALGRRGFDGAGMLLNQGTLAFELINNAAAPVAAMRTALLTALGRL